jgi:molybdopterin converting factor small subunit
MRVSIEYTAQLKAAAGVGSESVELDENVTAEAAILVVARRRGEAFSSLVLHNGAVKPHILVCVDDEQVSPAQPLSHGSRLLLLSPISGG